MGTLAIMSDLHVDINKINEHELKVLIQILHQKKVTRLHLAGDTANSMAVVLRTLEILETGNFTVTFNFGNHEMPDVASPEEIEAYSHPNFLNLETVNLREDLVLLGVNGWYDYSFSTEANHEKIVSAKNLYWYDRRIERGQSDPKVMATILEELSLLLTDLGKQQKDVILATHFVPQQAFIHYHQGKYMRWNQINAFLGSQSMGDLISTHPHVKEVVFGHTHRRFDSRLIEGTRYSARPFGYFYEWQLTRDFMLDNQLMTQFNPSKVRKLLRDHQESFDIYRKEHFQEEFLKSLTLIEY